MSVWGRITRELTVLGLEWHRNITENSTVELSPGWNLNITLPFVDVTIESSGWDSGLFERVTDFIRDPKNGGYYYKDQVFAMGYGISWAFNGNNGKLRPTHDASDRLLEDRPWTV